MATLYEENVRNLLMEKKKKLAELEEKDPDNEAIPKLEEEIHILEMLYENYTSGMGAFRRTKGSRTQH